MDNEFKLHEAFDKEYGDLLGIWKRLPPIVRAEKIIGIYLKTEPKTKKLNELFEQWLCDNALVALQADALEDYFSYVLSEGTANGTKCNNHIKICRKE